MQKLNLNDADGLELVAVENGMKVTEQNFGELKKLELLRLRRKNDQEQHSIDVNALPKSYTYAINLIKQSQKDIEKMTKFSGNDLLVLAELDMKKFKHIFPIQVLEEIISFANQIFVKRQNEKDEKGVIESISSEVENNDDAGTGFGFGQNLWIKDQKFEGRIKYL